MFVKPMLIAAMAGLVAAPSVAKIDTSQQIVQPADRQVLAFLTSMQAGRHRDAVEQLMSSPLWQAKSGARETMLGQIDAAVQAYGPVVAFEKVGSDTVGTMVRRERYFVQHRDMVTRWEFYLVRAGSGWQIGYFGFTDDPKLWF